VPLADIASISMSTYVDGFVCLHSQEKVRDIVIILTHGDCERYSELVTVVVSQIKKLTGKTIPVTFQQKIECNNSSKIGQMTTVFFQSETNVQGTVYKKLKSGCTVQYNPNAPWCTSK